MKRRRVDVERRGPRAELNLIGEVRKRSSGASRGCASLISRFLGGALLLLLLKLGLS